MIFWIFSAIMLVAGLIAALAENMRRATLALWVAGLSMGGIYLTLGAEMLAIVQWIVSTLVAISFIFFAAMFGEYPSPEGESEFKMDRKKALSVGGALLIGFGLAAVVYFGGNELPKELLSIPKEGNDISAIGRMVTDNHFVSLEVLALTLFLALIGGGVIARPEKAEQEGDR